MNIHSRLYTGQVYHRRSRPQKHELRYSVFTLLLDLSELDALAERLWLFSHNRFNLFGFYDRDFGDETRETLIEYITRQLQLSDIHTTPARVLLSCYPRVLGYVFNPLSLFYCLDEQDRCFAVIHEVHNTFGERHAYVLPVGSRNRHADETADEYGDEYGDESTRMSGSSAALEAKDVAGNKSGHGQWIHQQADKELFVSPFANMGMRYQFRLNMPAEKQVVVIRAFDDAGLLITASYTARRQSLNATNLARCFFTIPFLSAKVLLGIHWEALRLWIKGVPLFKHQPKRPT